MRRILFVDDEVHVLDGLRDMLRHKRREWAMTFAQGAEAALCQLEAEAFDVIVTDMQMPGMNGAELLDRVKREHPDTVRIVLSGQTTPETARSVVPLAQQFLSKPCDAKTLKGAIERTCELRDLLADHDLQEVVGALGSLPALPSTHAALTKALHDESFGAADVAALIERDTGLTAKTLQLVNSAFFAIRRRITSVQQAVVLLGAGQVQALALSTGVLDALPPAANFPLDAFQQRSLLVASAASKMLADKQDSEDAFTAGLLHEVGLLVLAARLPTKLVSALDQARESGRPLPDVEREVIGSTHAVIGAYLLGLWGLPTPVVEAVAWHHEPGRVAAERVDPLVAVHVAGRLVHSAGRPTAPELTAPPLDEELLVRLGVSDQLTDWQAIVADALAEAEAA